MIKRPKTVMCYICGREFGTTSIEIHLKSCKKKWDIEQQQKPPKERRPCPEAPKNFDEILTGSGNGGVSAQKLEEYNNDAYKNYNEKVLEPCPNCGRTFLPDRLQVHLRSCKGSGSDMKASNTRKPEENKASPQIGGGKMAQSMKVQSQAEMLSSSQGSPNGGKMGGSSAGQQKSPGGLSQTFKKPKTLVCYICGREFGTSSLDIHIKSCKQKWENEQSQKPKNERKPLPQPPKNYEDMISGNISQEQLDQYNEKAQKEFNEKGMDACPNCGRTFLPDRLIVHLRSCNKAHGVKESASPTRGSIGGGLGGGMGGASGGKPDLKPIIKPKTLVCYICGREFGTASLEIHLKTCKQKWENEQSQKPKHERKPLPVAPKNFDDLITGKVSADNMESYNEMAQKEFNEKGMDACPNCGRTFLPDRLIVHLRSCNKAHGKAPDEGPPGKGSSKKLGGVGGGGLGNSQSQASPSKGPAIIQRPKTIFCYICGREYGSLSIEIHLKSCKQKWEIEENKKPAKERRPVPQPPKSFDDMVIGNKNGEKVDMQQYNDEAYKQYNEVSLMACHNCGRTFLPDRLTIHLKSCDKAASKKPLLEDNQKSNSTLTASMNGSLSSAGQQMSTPDMRNKPMKGSGDGNCSMCGRQFSSNLMEQHVKSCQKRWAATEKLNSLNM
eukprot:403373615